MSQTPAEPISNPALSKPTPKRTKIRLDQFLVDTGRCASKTLSQGLILAGQVKIDGQVVDKPGTQYSRPLLEKMTIQIDHPLAYVSRGGLKLEKALQEFQINPTGLVCMDVGASTGGFTDCLLQNGAQKVYAIDVGHGQLDWKLRKDERVVALEKTNIRQVTTEQVPEPIGLCVMDVSFISMKKTLPAIEAIFETSLSALQAPPVLMSLVKPQFEYKDYCDAPGFDGVVKEAAQHQVILEGLIKDIQQEHPRLQLLGLSFSPITGPKGNIEFLLHAQYQPENPVVSTPIDIAAVVNAAHQSLLQDGH